MSAGRYEVIRTPRHVDNHVCYLLDEEGVVFMGDHIANGSSVGDRASGGNMGQYIGLARRLLDYDVKVVAQVMAS